MKLVVLVVRPVRRHLESFLAWVDPFADRVLHLLAVPRSPNLGVLAEQDLVLVSYGEYGKNKAPREVLDVYRLSDWSLRARLELDCRAHFNSCPRWSTFLASPDGNLVYVYKARSLGDHRADDFLCGLDPKTLEFSAWNYKLPECLAGWSRTARPAHAQLLFIADGLEVGHLPGTDLEQKVGFWLGPESGELRMVGIGPRPRAHSTLGHARALLFAPERPLTVVLCNDGTAHLIDPVSYRYLERQVVPLEPGHGMTNFAAQLEPRGRILYVGTAASAARAQLLTERVIVYDLDRGRRQLQWVLEEPLAHMALSSDGRYLYGAGSQTNRLLVFDARSGRTEAALPLDGFPQFLLPTA
jgi:hypothetical protein